MDLIDLNNDYTDKNTIHSYLPLYQSLLKRIKKSAKNVLEIGVSAGGSILLWHDYFINATIYGCDIVDTIKIQEIKKNDRIKLNLNNNAYNKEFIQKYFIDKKIKFDFLLDDGPHTLESMKQFIHLYLPLLEDNGILIIEDIPDINWIAEIKKVTPDNFKQYIEVFDLRKNKNRYDDLLFVINKNI
jgi:predicted O-methyltransferase YrrM